MVKIAALGLLAAIAVAAAMPPAHAGNHDTARAIREQTKQLERMHRQRMNFDWRQGVIDREYQRRERQRLMNYDWQRRSPERLGGNDADYAADAGGGFGGHAINQRSNKKTSITEMKLMTPSVPNTSIFSPMVSGSAGSSGQSRRSRGALTTPAGRAVGGAQDRPVDRPLDRPRARPRFS
jgi:hypothetical protein